MNFDVTNWVILRRISIPVPQKDGINQKKSNNNEFNSCASGYHFSAIVRNRERLRLFLDSAFADLLWLGARGNCSFGNFKQSQLIVVSLR